MTSLLPKWPKWGLNAARDRATAPVPLGQRVVSQVTGREFLSSDLGFVDVPDPYEPDWRVTDVGSEYGRRAASS